MNDDGDDPGLYHHRMKWLRGGNGQRSERFPVKGNSGGGNVWRRLGEKQAANRSSNQSEAIRHSGNYNRGTQRNRSSSTTRQQDSRGNQNRIPHNLNNVRQGIQSASDDNQRRNIPRKQILGFRRLEEIAKSESKETLAKLLESKTAFIEMIQSPIEKFDLFVVIMEIIAKVCQSSFDETKSKLLLDICNSNFLVSLKSYLMELPYVKLSNNLYWNDQESFWRNFVEFCECIVNTAPTLAINKCRSLFEATSIACLDNLKERHGFVLPEECSVKLVELREKMAIFEKKIESIGPSKKYRYDDAAPPEDFRELSIMPTREDLLHTRPFVRPNIVNGGYQDVEHYLDVQFRLLREDCYGPLRDGLNQFIGDQHKKKYDNIRIFRDVKFLKPYVSQTKIGSLVQLNVKHNKMFARTNWSNNKRFIFGSLVLFTKDNCKNFIAATILDREEQFLQQGIIPVSIIGQGYNVQLYNDDTYTMIESEVYFEPYYHVLKVLQDPTFPLHLAMKQYIVHVNPEPRPPNYLKGDTEFTVETLTNANKISEFEDLHEMIVNILDDENKDEVVFTPLDDTTWPLKDELSFNDSQYDAYKLALTHEFAVVQGPPGTGKTYLGIKVAKTLFENLEEIEGCLMLVICYTNHALDQFLEALLDITDSIVRIGGQSRNEAMEQINLNKLRRSVSIHSRSHQAFFDQKMALQTCISTFQKSLVRLDVLLNGVIRSDVIFEEVNEVQFLCKYYAEALGKKQDPLFYWLFEENSQFIRDIGYLFEENIDENVNTELEKENRKRTGVMLDDLKNDDAQSSAYRKEISSFSATATTLQIKHLIAQYKSTQDQQLQRNIAYELQLLDSYNRMYNEMSAHRLRRTNLRITPHTNFSRISMIDRWSLYFMWVHRRTQDTRNEVGHLQEQVNTATTIYEESRMMVDIQVMKNSRIVGMTTSGAARMRKLLQTLNPPIVIVEEAAEVLEQHIITSLTEGCKHLILIGDHQQLRPSASHMRLAKHFQLEVSLFERMITNGIHSRRLSVQHRMRPEIAALICPHIYPELQNHPSVFDFPNVKGITKNLFFFNHDFKEEELQENASRTNHKEADMTLGLAHYLMQQGYVAEDITILAAYKGQMFYMRKESIKYPHLNGVKITVVDNYQGEESKIILLSLVRNNDDNKIGFLGTSNRICVALSRAKHGFYIFGNIDTLKLNSELWKKIATTLESNNSIGSNIELKCQNHSDSITIIEKLEDFRNVPEGGCLLPCEMTLPQCGHKCLLMCHGYDRDHTTGATKCPRKCERVICELMHVCPKKCSEECGPCMRKMLKKLPCGHEMQMYCHLDPENPTVKCLTMVEATLPDCKHKANKLCHMDVKNVRCDVDCEFRVESCGHSCLKKCHVKNDPDHEEYLCMKQCAKAKLNCVANLEGDRGDHQCYKRCHEPCDKCTVPVVKRRLACNHMVTTKCGDDPDTLPCLKKCSRKLPCGHVCKKPCSVPCEGCEEIVEKIIPDCQHKVKIMCKLEPVRKRCFNSCERTLSCGHKCKGLCGNECVESECTEPSQRKILSPCGHLVSLPCNITNLSTMEVTPKQLLSACRQPCGAILACKHVCAGTCAFCMQGRMHQPCQQTCNQLNICEHQCEEPCNQICPPCKKQCEVRCQHSRCNQLCGAPCKSCKEKCGRRCKHGACKNRCGEACSRAACDEPCPRKQKCGHACRGLCGEPCPPICKTCKPDVFPVDFLGDEFQDTDRFVLLQDCGHVMEVENMDNLMRGDRETVKIRCCPTCRKPIINTGRYKDLVNATFKQEINVIKTRVYGTKKSIEAATHKLQAKIGYFRSKYIAVMEDNNNLRMVYLNIQSLCKTQKRASKLQIDIELVCLNILDMISDCYNSYLTNKATNLKTELVDQVKMLCKIFSFHIKKGSMLKVSEQQQMDAKLEIRRLNAIVQLAKLSSHNAYTMSKDTPDVKAAFAAANQSVFKPAVFNENETMNALKHLEETVKASGIVTKQERDYIVKAIGLKAGHWYKCPNGHFYCIGECGGAMEEGNCPDCKLKIGGGSHRLLPNNRHAPEMDGSKFAAWSQFNNMANYDM